jgi:thimet oligopeptidase
MRTAFGANKLDPVVGMRYRRSVLSQGSQRLPSDLVRDFLGRDFNAKAFYEDLKK